MYDPFLRGGHPVGVRTVTLADAAREGRALPVEIWYPATAAYAGQDLVEATQDTYEVIPGFPFVHQEAVRDAALADGLYPLVAFSHGFGGSRRQSTFLCTHLASHGYVVAAVDHTGNTMADMLQLMIELQGGGSLPDTKETLDRFMALRPEDVRLMLDRVIAGAGDVGQAIDVSRIGMSGHSFGGWTTLMVTAADRRIGAALPLAPAGGASPLPAGPLQESVQATLRHGWGRPVPTLYLVADGDTLLPLAGMRELLALTPAPRRMAVLAKADHMHFCDRIEQVHEMFRMMPPPGDFAQVAQHVRPIAELSPGSHGYDFNRGLGLAHFDAHLKRDGEAQAFLASDLTAVLAARGITIEVAD